MFYSQQNEDKIILEKYINQNHNNDGTFLELGALDGIKFSNTYYFEKNLNFSGVLIEANPNDYIKLKNNRKKCECFNAAITDEKIDYIDFGVPNSCASEQGGIVKTHRVKDSIKNTFKVKTMRLDNILNQYNITYLDFISLDVEGGELEVLKTLNFNLPIYLMCIELDNNNPTKDIECREILKKMNLDFDYKFGNNEFWINKNYYRKNLLFKHIQ
jgi:FkbM family methyltransferase